MGDWRQLYGGERGIRTLDRVAPVPPFQGGDLNRSSSSPFTPALKHRRRRIIYDLLASTKSVFSEYHLGLTHM